MTYRSGGPLQTVLDYEYSTGNLIGHGAFALVFKGRRKRTHEPVAIKQISLKSVPGRLSNIRQKEIAILKDVKHCNVVQLYDYHEEHLHIYLVMEYCNGGDLGDYLQAKQTLSEDSIRHLTNHISGALNALQRLNIMHRDIKPQNLLLSFPPVTNGNVAGGGSRRDRPIRESIVKLADFGFARYLSGTDMAATLCGSPLYMAPEILLGEKYDSKADLWSVGTILYQCHTGTAPFLATNPHALRKRYEKEKLIPKIPDGTSRYLISLLLQLLKKNPKERLSHEDFSAHVFLRDPSSLPPGNLVMSSLPPSRAKSSPVPIQRQIPSSSPFPSSSSPFPSSSRHSASSPRYSPFEISGDAFVSPSSGPPSIHPVGSVSSLPRYASPGSDIAEGFVLVDAPQALPYHSSSHRSSSPLSATSSPRSGSFCSACSHTPSSSGPTPPSSYGSASLQRYRSLTTPFYLTAKNSNGNTASAGVAERVEEVASRTNESRQLSRSNSSRRQSADNVVLSHTPPFCRLMQLAPSPSHSHSSSPYSTLSCHPPFHSHSPSSSSSPSPFPTLPSSTTSTAQHTASNISNTSASPTGARHSLRYSLSAHNSGTKLSSLAEQRETELHHHRGEGRWREGGREERRGGRGGGREEGKEGREGEKGMQRVDSGLRFEDLITPSQFLGSDEDDEENFPLSLSLTSSQCSIKTDEQEEVGEEELGRRGGGSSGLFLMFERKDVQCTPHGTSEEIRSESTRGGGERGGEGKRVVTGRGGGGGGRRGRDTTVRRRSTISSSSANPQLAEELRQIRRRAASLSARQSQLLSPCDTPTPSISGHYNYQLSPGAQIKHVPLPFAFSSTSSTSTSSPALSPGGHKKGAGEESGGETPHPCLATLSHSMMLVRELVAMAKAREGPIMLLSSDLSASAGSTCCQRYSEQLVLYAKAITVLECGLRQYEIGMATHSMEPSQTLRTAEVEARELQEMCLERAKHVKEEIERVRGGGGRRRSIRHSSHLHHPHPHTSLISAEKLLLIEALDMCKNAVLSEQSADSKECVKRYRRAKMIFAQLLSDARSPKDKAVLQSYLNSVHTRIHHLTSL